MVMAKANAAGSPCAVMWHLIWMRGVVKREAEQSLAENWEEIDAIATTGSSKDVLTDRLRAYLDREPIAEIRKLFQHGGKIAFNQAIIELVKRLF